MYTHNDLIDVILQALLDPKASLAAQAAADRPAPKRWKFIPDSTPKGRRFLTEAEIKKTLTPASRHLTIPREAIVSPLASDWLALQGIEIVRE